jgi:hypothetical protein
LTQYVRTYVRYSKGSIISVQSCVALLNFLA